MNMKMNMKLIKQSFDLTKEKDWYDNAKQDKYDHEINENAGFHKYY